MPRFTLFIFLLATSVFAATNIWQKCAGFAEIEPGAHDSTTRYLQMLYYFGAEKNAIGEADLEHLLAADKPINPFTGRDDLKSTVRHVYEKAFADILSAGDVDWPRVQRAVAPLIGKKREEQARREVAVEKTNWRVGAKDVDNTYFNVAVNAGITDVRIYNDGSSAVASGFNATSSHWMFRQSSHDAEISLGGGTLGQIHARPGQSSLVVFLDGYEGLRPDVVKVFDGKTGAVLHNGRLGDLPQERSPVPPTGFVFEPSPGKLAVLSAWGEKSQGVWATFPGGSARKLPALPPGMRFAPSADGKKVYAFGIVGNEAVVHDGMTGAVLHRLPFESGTAKTEDLFMHCNAKGELFMVVRGGNAVEAYHVTAGKHFKFPGIIGMRTTNPPFIEDSAGKVSFAFSVNGESVRMIDLVGGASVKQKISPAMVDKNGPLAFLYFPDGRRVVMASDKNALSIVDMDSREVTRVPGHQYHGFHKTPDGRVLGFYPIESQGYSPYGQSIEEYSLGATELFGPR